MNDKNNAVQASQTGRGRLPDGAPLAMAYVPMQQSDPEQYAAGCALIKGTLFPGLDLPYMGVSNTKEKKPTLLHELQAMSFAIAELGLYLDTHPDDAEALQLYNQYAEQYAMVQQQAAQQGMTLTQIESAACGSYGWLNGPWPWDYETEA